jgi:hypothetical protein
LRAINHALRTEDAKSDTRLKKAQSDWWNTLKATKPNPPIFWEFIDYDRNRLLKEVELPVRRLFQESLQDGTLLADNLDGQQLPQQLATRAPPPTSICTYQMKSGRFEKQDPRDLVRDAIEWWERQLDDIEQKAAASSP